MTAHKPFNTSPLPVKLRVEDYLLLDRSGAFDDYARTELIEGEILFMNAQHRPHMYAKSELAFALRMALKELGSSLYVGTEASVALSDHDLPEPDIVVTSEPRGEGPVPRESVALVIEVADTTAPFDLGRKATVYARHSIPEYWVVELNARVIHQMWAPKGEAYAERREIAFGERIAAATIAGLAVETAGI